MFRMHAHNTTTIGPSAASMTGRSAGTSSQSESPSLLKGHFKSPWLFSSAIVIIFLLSAMAIAALQNYSDQRRQQQILLESLGQISSQLSSVQWEIATKNELDEETLQESTLFREQSSAIMARLKHADGNRNNRSLPQVEACLNPFLTYAREQVHLLQRGKKEQARQQMLQEVDSSYDRLNEAIQNTNQEYGMDADRTNMLADWGTGFILLAAAAGIGILFHRFNRSRQTALVLLSEQKVLQQREEHFHSLIRHASDIISVWDTQGNIRYMSPAILRILGHEPSSLTEQTAFELIHPEDQSAAGDFLSDVCAKGGSLSSGWRIQHGDGSWRHVEVIAANLMEDASIAGILVTYRDVTERKTIEDQLAYQALHDSLTGLPNRAMLMDRLKEGLAVSRQKKTSTAAFFLDLDNFKIINDSLGHEAGDKLLITVAERLRQCVRPNDLVARLGGDEFTVLLEDLADKEEATRIADRIVQALRAPVTLLNTEVFISGSLGIAYTTDVCDPPEVLLRDADTAMYEAKTNGKANYVLFEPSMNDRVVERMELEAGLRTALQQNQFVVHYQPLINLETGHLIGVEALVRWQHPTRGLIAPGKFIPIAEETGIIVPLGYWVLEESCRQAKQWREMYPERPLFTVNVNLSGRQLQCADVVERVKAILEKTQITPGVLKLEITESVMMTDMEETLEKLHQLKALGVKLAMDDFGTGYSSMANLSLFPLDTIKIDRAFISRLSDQPQVASIIEAIVQLSKSLNLDVTGEGVETEEQVMHLQSLGCNVGQGYYFARPLTAAHMGERIAEGSKSCIKPQEEYKRNLIEEMLRAA